jgi:hypothetical protein
LASGLQTVETGYFFTSLLLPRFIQAKLEKILSAPSSKGVADWKGSKMTGFIVRNILRIDYFISLQLSKIKVKLPGLSNFAICKKSV